MLHTCSRHAAWDPHTLCDLLHLSNRGVVWYQSDANGFRFGTHRTGLVSVVVIGREPLDISSHRIS